MTCLEKQSSNYKEFRLVSLINSELVIYGGGGYKIKVEAPVGAPNSGQYAEAEGRGQVNGNCRAAERDKTLIQASKVNEASRLKVQVVHTCRFEGLSK